MFQFDFFRRNVGSPSLNPADVRKGTVLTHLPTGIISTVVYAVGSDVMLIDDNGQLSAPSEKQLIHQYRCSNGSLNECEINILWHRASELYRSDKRLLTRLGLRGNSPESIRKALAV